MHVFQPVELDLIEKNAFQLIGNNWMLVTTCKGEKVNTMTASWGGLGVMWGKNVAYIVIRESRYTKELLDATDTFSLTFFADPPRAEMKYLGAVSGRDEDKIASARLEVCRDGETAFIGDGSLVFLCRKMSATPITEETILDKEALKKWYPDGNYHTLYIGEITKVLAR
jgi:flavin reductase (DIM6/NTAB) family NADH-FMN oxidoreductase RutF